MVKKLDAIKLYEIAESGNTGYVASSFPILCRVNSNTLSFIFSFFRSGGHVSNMRVNSRCVSIFKLNPLVVVPMDTSRRIHSFDDTSERSLLKTLQKIYLY